MKSVDTVESERESLQIPTIKNSTSQVYKWNFFYNISNSIFYWMTSFIVVGAYIIAYFPLFS